MAAQAIVELFGGTRLFLHNTGVLPNSPTIPKAALSIPVFSEESFSYSTDLQQFTANSPNVFLNLVNVFNTFRRLENQISEIEYCHRKIGLCPNN